MGGHGAKLLLRAVTLAILLTWMVMWLVTDARPLWLGILLVVYGALQLVSASLAGYVNHWFEGALDAIIVAVGVLYIVRARGGGN